MLKHPAIFAYAFVPHSLTNPSSLYSPPSTLHPQPFIHPRTSYIVLAMLEMFVFGCIDHPTHKIGSLFRSPPIHIVHIHHTNCLLYNWKIDRPPISIVYFSFMLATTSTGKTFMYHDHCNDGALQEIIDAIFGDELVDAAPPTAAHHTDNDEATPAVATAVTTEPHQITKPNRYIQLSSMPTENDESQSDCLCTDSRKSMVFRETTV